jgi:Metallo-peptidase family M12B Reprolysin-like/Calx-beta domain
MPYSHSYRTLLLLLAVLGVFAVASLWPATPPVLSAPAENRVASAFTPQSSDALWRDLNPEKVSSQQQQQTAGRPNKYRSLSLDTIHLQSLLQRAPREFSKDVAPIISLPMPDGSMLRFKIYDSPIMEEGLASRYPQIRTFNGEALDGSAVTTRFDWTPQGFHAILLTTRGTVLIEPDGPGQTSSYISYFQGDAPAGSMECDVDTSTQEDPLVAVKQTGERASLVSSGAALRTYRLAVAATAEYTQAYGGGTVGGGLSAVTTTVNLVNAVFERDVAVRLVLIANEDQIIFTDSVSDGYTSDNVGSLIGENQTKLDAVIGSANYDIGHVFDGRILPGGFQFQGQAGPIGTVCRSGVKARGVNIVKSLSPSNTIAYYSAAHEMGHQFGASHTFNATSGTCGPQRASATAYEPGTGSTIMGYRFACGNEDLMSSDTYFHTGSIEQIVTYTTGVNGGSCPVTTPTGNNIPTVNAGVDFTIPQSTPFMLAATGSDPDGDTLTYTWEEFDLGSAGPPNTDDGSRPIFRSLAPSTDPARMFPSLFNVLCPQCPALGQSLPLTTRTMKFRATVRDNRPGAGAASSDETTVNVRAESGPFTVNQPGTWNVGSQQLVTWNPANTNNAPVSCDTVRITLSRDGNTFPIVLANNTPNDGSETITVPGTPSTSARIKVEAVGNIFFNISPAFQINGLEDMQLSSSSYLVNEASGSVSVTVTRGNTSGAATVNYRTSDAAGLTNCTIISNLASERCDYATAAGTLRFAAGESSKSFTIPLVNDVLVEDAETFTVTLSGATGTPLGAPQQATITIFDDDATPATSNPIDNIPFFVTQQYIDFLGRLPDSTGFANWVATLNGCPNGGFGENDNPGCDRVHVSAGFFLSPEFQGRGYFAYRFYEVALDRRPAYAEFVPDMAIVGGPQSPESEVLSKATYTEAWTQRPEFKTRYDALSHSAYVNALEVNAEVVVSNKQALIDALNGGQMTRGEVLRNIVESTAVGDKFFNRAFVAMQYFGYLRRDPDTVGFQNWLNTLNADPSNFRHMIFGFLFSPEYRQRFGP